MTIRKIFAMLFVAFAGMLSAHAESKPPIDHSVYDSWKSISDFKIPFNGNYLYYEVKEQEGDTYLVYRDLRSGREIRLERSVHLSMNREQSIALARISPSFADKREARIKKTPAEKQKQDSIAIVNLSTGAVTKIADAKSARFGDVLGGYFAYKPSRSYEASAKATKEAVGKEASDTSSVIKAASKKDESWKNALIVYSLKEMRQVDTLRDVSSSFFDKTSRRIIYTITPTKKDTSGVKALCIYNLASGSRDTLITFSRKEYLGEPDIDVTGRYLTFLASHDTTKDNKDRPDLYLYDGKQCRVLLSASDPRIPEGMGIRTKYDYGFNSDSTRFFFGLHPIAPKKDTSVPAFEKAKLVIWTWDEEYLRSEQKRYVSSEKGKTFLSSIAVDGCGPLVTYEDADFRGLSIREGNRQDWVLMATDKPYRVQQQWDRETIYDVYKVSLADGARTLVKSAAKINLVSSSPDGRWYPYFNYEDLSWWLYDIASGVERNLTASLDGLFYDDESDTPSSPSPIASPRWSKDSKYFLLKDKYDYWKLDPSGVKAPVRITSGAASKTTYNLVTSSVLSSEGIRLNDRSYVDLSQPQYFSIFDHESKEAGFAVLEKGRMKLVSKGAYSLKNTVISTTAAGRGKRVYAFNRGNYEIGQNAWLLSEGKSAAKGEQQITDINPQQRAYNWGTVEPVSWSVADGSRADGLLFKPEDFDPAKKYPVMVYFYERYSDELYAVRTPAPSRSTINIPYFVSNGYIVFVPDIRYKTGHPGESAIDYILSGCDMLCRHPWVNAEKMGIQGQSWGGYQVAYLITHTGRFAAAGAGAPVSNMTSAYGGIRWGTGMVRQFQYEQGQSRIGTDLWSGFDLYIENSPLFTVPSVTTPVLIMHNDKDDAVPWWQGIEFFTALRRCGKKAWMLQYVDETHNLSMRKNAKDLSVRLSDFFDHYLKDTPMPSWMQYGVPAWDPEAE